MLVNMKQILEEAEKNGYAIGCINTPNVEMCIRDSGSIIHWW